jgi:hypothetical protein
MDGERWIDGLDWIGWMDGNKHRYINGEIER